METIVVGRTRTGTRIHIESPRFPERAWCRPTVPIAHYNGPLSDVTCGQCIYLGDKVTATALTRPASSTEESA